jgi:hypothetical protein
VPLPRAVAARLKLVFRLSNALPLAIALDQLCEAADDTHQFNEAHSIEFAHVHRRAARRDQRLQVKLQSLPVRENISEHPVPIVSAKENGN